MKIETLEQQIKVAIVEALALRTTDADDIADDAPLFGDAGMGLDSVDALEIAYELEERFGVEIPDDEAHRAVFTSVRTLADFVRDQGRG
ncbi:MAG: acyl carrier protein [Alphaproteobacteria bacterium]|nr:acyl carrier protein [Alphaproteobacteria bacterium]